MGVWQAMRVVLAWLWEMFKPPSGVQARRVVMAFTLLVMAGRFGFKADLAWLLGTNQRGASLAVRCGVFAVVRGALLDDRYPPVDNGRLRDQRLWFCALYRPGFRRVAGVPVRSLLHAHGAHSAGRRGRDLENPTPC